MRPHRALIVILSFAFAAGAARGGDRRFSVSASGAVTTTSNLFTNPNARDDFIRGACTPIQPVFSAGIDARTGLTSFGPRFGPGAEYIAGSLTTSVVNTSGDVPVTAGYAAIPVELTAYFSVPVGGERIEFYFGGGAGVYLGEPPQTFAGVDAVTVDRNIRPGIHILNGVEYALGETVALGTQMRFSNVPLETVQEFPESSTACNGYTVPLPRGSFASRVQVDGTIFSVGVAFRMS